jgi:hypothetical protein
MSQSRCLQDDYSKKIRQAASNAAMNMAVSDLIAARNVRRSAGGKRLTKSSHSYKHVISLLESVGVKITYDALMKRVARASVEDSILDKIIPTITSDKSEVSTLTPHEQTDDSLSIENMVVPAKSASHTNETLETPQVQSRTGGRPKGSTMAKKKQDELNKTKCIDAIVVK